MQAVPDRGDIVVEQQYDNFDLTLEAKLTSGANCEVIYFVTERLLKSPGSGIGLKFQILDDELHPDAIIGKDGIRNMGFLK